MGKAMFPCRLQNVNATSKQPLLALLEGQFFLEMGLRRTIRVGLQKNRTMDIASV